MSHRVKGTMEIVSILCLQSLVIPEGPLNAKSMHHVFCAPPDNSELVCADAVETDDLFPNMDFKNGPGAIPQLRTRFRHLGIHRGHLQGP